MKRTVLASAMIISAVAMLGGILDCSQSPFWLGSSGPSGIDTIARLPRLAMETTDLILIPSLVFPDNAATEVTLHLNDSTTLKKPILPWKKVAGATGYRVVLAANARFAPTIIDDATLTDTAKALTGISLSYNTPYYWAVSAIDDSGKEGWSPIWRFTTKSPTRLLKFRKTMSLKSSECSSISACLLSPATSILTVRESGSWAARMQPSFHPDSLDLGKWADVAKSAHCKYAVLTTKHHGGFCLWPSKGPWTQNHPHSIVQSKWYAEHGDRGRLPGIRRLYAVTGRGTGLLFFDLGQNQCG